MRQSVIDKFSEFSVTFEGRVASPYRDVLGYVTVGEGNLIDPISLALSLPWKIDGRPATRVEVEADWKNVKANADPKLHWKYAEKLSRIRLDDAGIDELVRSKLLANEKILRRDFRHWDGMPADAQLAICSMAWALGAGFAATFKNFARAANSMVTIDENVFAPDYAGMKASCKINAYDEVNPKTGKRDNPKYNPGVIPRNKANELCLENARVVAEHGMDPDVLHWPNAALPSPRTIPAPEGDGDLQLAAVRAFGARTDEVGDITREAIRGLSDTEPAPPPDPFEEDTRVDTPSLKRS